MAMDAGQLATLAIVGCLGLERALTNLNCNMAESVKKLHWNCSRCCDVDMERATPPTTPVPKLSNPLVEEPMSRV